MKFFVSFLLSFVLCLLSINVAFAQSKNSITASPQLIQLDLSQHAPEAEYTYTNNTGQTVELVLSMQDVKELEDQGIPGILDPNETRDYNFGLSSWARFSNNNLIIQPGESKTVKVFIDKNRLTIGGHYGSVLAEIVQRDAGKTVKLRAILSTLLFVRSGSENEQERANVVQISLDSNPFSFPKTVTFRLQNSGNVELIPYGTLTITNPLGKEVAKGIVNEDSLITLPDSTRRYMVKINKHDRVILPGIYKAKIEIRYGKNKFKISENSYFFMIAEFNKYVLLGLSALVGGGFVVFKITRKKRS